MEQQTGSKSGKEYIKAVYCHHAYLTYMQSTSYEMLGWMKHKLELRLRGRNINNLSYADDTNLMAEREEELKSLLKKVKEENEIASLKLYIQKTKVIVSGHIPSWIIRGEAIKIVTRLFYWAAKALQMVTSAMILKDSCSYMQKKGYEEGL